MKFKKIIKKVKVFYCDRFPRNIIIVIIIIIITIIIIIIAYFMYFFLSQVLLKEKCANIFSS